MEIEEINLLYIVGPLIFMWAIYTFIRAKNTRHWPSVTGKVLKTVESYTEEYETGSNPMSNGSSNSVKFKKIRFSGVRSALHYTYIVSEQKYVGQNLYSAEVIPFKSSILADLYVGDLVKVFYNTSNPHDSFLAHSFTVKTIFTMIAGALITFAPFLMEFATKLSG